MPLLKASEVLRAGERPIQFSRQAGVQKSAEVILNEEKRAAEKSVLPKNVFLSHRYTDATRILGVKRIIERCGYSVYVDWVEDPELERRKVTPATARRLRRRMDECGCLIYAHTINSPTSVWMPWELGYFDGKNGRAAILPIDPTDGDRMTYRGPEYLGLYPYVTREPRRNTARLDLWINRVVA